MSETQGKGGVNGLVCVCVCVCLCACVHACVFAWVSQSVNVFFFQYCPCYERMGRSKLQVADFI